MKKVLLSAFALCMLGFTTNAQTNDMDDDGAVNERMGLDGSPMPGGHAHIDEPWCAKSTLSIAPFQYTENGVGFGLSFEHALDPRGIVSLYVPAIATFNLGHRDYNYYNGYYNGYGYPDQSKKNDVMGYIMPGIKFYPTGMGKVKYAVGPSLVVGYGQKTLTQNMPYVYDPTYGYYNYVSYQQTYNRFMMGMMLNNSLNINATRHLYIGAEVGFGFSYFDQINNYNYGSKFLTQGGFKIGYTF